MHNSALRVLWNVPIPVPLRTLVLFYSGTQISDQQKEHWTQFVSNDVDMCWSQEKIEELCIYLNEDPPAASSSTNQDQETRSRSAEIATNIAKWDISNAKIAAATTHQGAVTSSTIKYIHTNSDQEEPREATSGISSMIRDGGESSSTGCGNLCRVTPGQQRLKSTAIASFAGIPFGRVGISERQRKNPCQEGDGNESQVEPGHDIRHQSAGSPAPTTVSEQEKGFMYRGYAKGSRAGGV